MNVRFGDSDGNCKLTDVTPTHWDFNDEVIYRYFN